MPEAEVTVSGLPQTYVDSLRAAREAAISLAAAEKEIVEQSGKTEKAIKAEVAALKKSEAQRRAGLATSEKTVARLVDEERALKGTTAAAKLSEEAQASLAKRGMDQLRRETANAGRSLSMLFDEQNKVIASTKGMTQEIKQQITMQARQFESAQDVIDALQDLEFNTDDTKKSTEEYTETVKALQKRLAGINAGGYKLSKDRLDSIEKAMMSLNVPGANLIKSFKDMNDSLEVLSRNGTAAEVALLKTAIAVAAVGAAVVIAVAGVALLTAAIVGVVAKSDEWNEELVELGINLDASGTAAVNRAAAAIDVLGAVIKAGAVALAEKFAPGVTSSSVALIAFSLAVVDTIKNSDALIERFKLYAKLAEFLLPGPLKLLALGIRKVGEAAFEAAKGFIDLSKEGKDYVKLAEELIGKQVAINQAVRDGADAQKELAEETKESFADALGRLEDEARLKDDSLDDTLKRIEAERKAFLKAAADKLRAEKQLADARVMLGKQVANAAVAVAQLIAGENEKAGRAIFLFAQGVGLATVAVDTAVGVQAALKVPAPLGPILAGTILAAGIANAAVIAATTIGSFSSASVPSAGAANAGIQQTRGEERGGAPVQQGATGSGPSGFDEGGGGGGAKPDHQGIPVTDGVVGRGMAGRNFQPAEGDRFVRSGELGATSLQSPQAMDLMRRQIAVQERGNQLLQVIADKLGLSQRQATGIRPARSY